MKATPVFNRADAACGVLAGVLSFVVYFLTTAPNVTLLDSGEFVVAAQHFGVPHPTGYPLWTLLAWLFQLPPIGNAAWQVALFSGVCGAATVGLAALLAHSALRWMFARPEVPPATLFLVALSMTLLFAFSVPMWSQAVIAEVYTLHTLVVAVFLLFQYLWVRQPRRLRWFFWSAFALALGFSNHHLVLALVPLPVLVLVLLRRDVFWDAAAAGALTVMLGFLGFAWLSDDPALLRTAIRFFLCVAAGFAVLVAVRRGRVEWRLPALLPLVVAAGLLPYLQMPLASATNPPMNWSYARTAEGFYHAINRSQYAGSLSDQSLRTLGGIMGTAPETAPRRPPPFEELFDPPPGRGELASEWVGHFWYQLLVNFTPWGVLALFAVLFALMRLPRQQRVWVYVLLTGFLLAGFLQPAAGGAGADLAGWWVQMPYHGYTFLFFALAAAAGGGFLFAALAACRTYRAGGAGASWGGWQGGSKGESPLRALTERPTRPDAPNRSSPPGCAGFWHWLRRCTRAVAQRLQPLRLLLASVKIRQQRRPRGKSDRLLAAKVSWTVPAAALLLVAPAFTLWNNSSPSSQRERWFGWRFGHDMLSDLPQGAVVFGGTDPGRFVPTYMIFGESALPPERRADPDFDRRDLYIITQNALADPLYLRYLRDHYTTDRPPPRNAFERWLGRDTHYPETPLVLPTLEELDEIVRAAAPERPVNDLEWERASREMHGAVAQWIFDRNKHAHAFFMEESFPMEWAYAHAVPDGLLLRLEAEPVAEIPASLVEADMEFWEEYVGGLLADRNFARDFDARRSFSKLRVAGGNLYRHRALLPEARAAYHQALRLWPANPEAVLPLAAMLWEENLLEEARALAAATLALDPLNRTLARTHRQALLRIEADGRIRELRGRLDERPGDVDLLERLAALYLLIGEPDEAEQLFFNAAEADDPVALLQTAVRFHGRNHMLDASLEFSRRLVEEAPESAENWMLRAKAFVLAADDPATLEALREAVRAGDRAAAANILADPAFAHLRDDEAFQSLIIPWQEPAHD